MTKRLISVVKIGLVALLTQFCLAETNSLESIRVHDAPDHTRVVFDTRSSADYHHFLLTNPSRFVVDLSDTKANAKFESEKVDSRVVAGIRRAQRKKGVYRVVLDLKRAVNPRDPFVLKPVRPYGHRLVIDLYWNSLEQKSGVQAVPADQRDVVVAIDAGHGGEDPGAIGINKVVEKHVVLSIARGVKRHLDAATGFKALLVRDGDYYIALRKRPQWAREKRADFFLSIHADAFKSSLVSGASVYALSQKRATSETARWLVENENRSDLLGGGGEKVVLDDYDDSVVEILLDMSMDANLGHSIDAGEAVLAALSGVARLHKGQLQQAGFVVLKSPDVPSILVETGYISNPTEARLLATTKYQQRIARAIADGVREYMHRNPPPGSLIAVLGDSATIHHLVKRGDTLSEIALRYDASAAAIRNANRLRSNVIRTGEVLIIPKLGHES